MKRNYFFWILFITFFCMCLIFYSMWSKKESSLEPNVESMSSHPQVPFHSYISGVGVIEASSDNISIGVPVNGIVEKVAVSAGEVVKKGEILFSLENQDLQADLKAKRVDYEIAQAKLQKLQAMPRQEDAAAASALLKNVRLEVEQTKNLYESVQELGDSRAMSLAEINRRRFGYEQALARLQEAEANEEKIKGGAWKPDLDIAFLEVEQAKTSIGRVEAAIQRTIIRSPIDGKVLQIKIHEGESTAGAKGPLMIVGNTEKIYLKVSINQFDAPFFPSRCAGSCLFKGELPH